MNSCPSLPRLLIVFGLIVVSLLASTSAAGAQASELKTGPDWIWDLQTEDQTVAHQSDIRSLVYDLQEHDGRMYAAGKFLEARSATGTVVSRPYLAAFDINTGALDTTFAPQLDGAAYSIEFAPDGTMLVGGEFTGSLAVVDPITGAANTSFAQDIHNTWGPGAVWDIEVVGAKIYLAGNFDRVGTNTYGSLARLDLASGALDPTWKPMADGGYGPERGTGQLVWNLEVDSVRGRVYVVGKFDTINGNAEADNFATLDTATGAVITTLPQGTPDLVLNHEACDPGQVIPDDCDSFDMWFYDVKLDGDNVWIGGQAHQTIQLNASDLAVKKFSFANPGLGDITGGGDTQALFIGEDTVWSGCHCWGSVGVFDPLAAPITYLDGYQDFWEAFALVDHQTVKGGFGMDRVTGDLSSQQFDLTGQAGAWALYEDSNGRLWTGGEYDSGSGRGLSGLARFTPLGGVDVDAPTACVATEVSGAINISWTPATGDSATHFVVRRSRDGSSFAWAARTAVPSTQWSDTSTTAASVYTYSVEGQNGASASSRTTCASGGVPSVGDSGPLAPTACRVTTANGEVEVSWDRASNDNADHFIIRRARNGATTYWRARPTAAVSSWTDTNVVVGDSYAFTVETLAGQERSLSTSCSPSAIVVTGDGVVGPLSCTATLASDDSIAVTWAEATNDSATNDSATRYIIRRSRNGGTSFWAGVSDASPWTNSAIASGTYLYTVEAVNSSGTSTPTICGPIGGTIVAPSADLTPVTPLSCVATKVSATEISVTWAGAADDNATDYIIRRSRNDGAMFWAGVAATSDWTNTGVGAGTYNYTVEARSSLGSSAPQICGSGVEL